MWIQVLFDLPVVEDSDRKTATRFRNNLLDLGFKMVQFSVYQRFCPSKDISETFIKHVETIIPENGSVHILSFTDKQYENIVSYHGKKKKKQEKTPEQYELF